MKVPIFGILLFIATACVVAFFAFVVNFNPVELSELAATEPALIVLTAPVDCEIGQLIELDASESEAVNFSWKVVPPTKNFRVIDCGRRALFCTSKAGNYLFILAVAKENSVDCKIKRIVVKSNSVTIEEVERADPFVKLVEGWLPAEPDKKTLEKLARSFERVASAGHDDVVVLVKTTGLSNKGILGSSLEQYKPFLTNLSKYLKENYQNQPIESHIELWFKLASALRSI